MPFDIGNFVFFTVLLSVGVPLLITVGVLFVIYRVFRNVFPSGKQAADAELRERLARGEISPSEFQAREDALNRED